MERTQQNNPSNPDIFEGRWKQMRGELRSWWGRLTDDDFEQIGGQQEKLLGRLLPPGDEGRACGGRRDGLDSALPHASIAHRLGDRLSRGSEHQEVMGDE